MAKHHQNTPLTAASSYKSRMGAVAWGLWPSPRLPSPLISRVEDWRAGVGRSLCSLLARPFVCECHTISTMPHRHDRTGSAATGAAASEKRPASSFAGCEKGHPYHIRI